MKAAYELSPTSSQRSWYLARVAQRLLAMAAAIWHNWSLNTDNKWSLIAYDH